MVRIFMVNLINPGSGKKCGAGAVCRRTNMVGRVARKWHCIKGYYGTHKSTPHGAARWSSTLRAEKWKGVEYGS
jgi:hypothetical protein